MTYHQIAADFKAWGEKFDTAGFMTREEFDAMAQHEKVSLLIAAFGKEPVTHYMNPRTGSVDTIENWAAKGFTSENADLVAVEQDIYGTWTEAV